MELLAGAVGIPAILQVLHLIGVPRAFGGLDTHLGLVATCLANQLGSLGSEVLELAHQLLPFQCPLCGIFLANLGRIKRLELQSKDGLLLAQALGFVASIL